MNSSSRQGENHGSNGNGNSNARGFETTKTKGGREGLWRGIVPVVYRLNNDGGTHGGAHPSLLQEVCEERGWKEYTEENKGNAQVYGWSDNSSSCSGGWNLWWRCSTMKSAAVRQLSPDQLTNHIPKASQLYRKDCLARYLSRMLRIHGPIYDFSPLSFNLPLEYTRLCSEHSRRKRILQYSEYPSGGGGGGTCDGGINLQFSEQQLVLGRRGPVWICKPVGRSQGKGILVFDRVAELAYDSSSVVQEYISRPYLIAGYKWDLRIYVCITSLNPLLIYAYREGLTRFATNKYDLTSLFDHFSHLTNTTLNKQGPAYKQNKEEIGPGCKWTIGRLRRYFHDNGVDDWLLWQRIFSILVLTIIGEAHTLTNLEVGLEKTSCFEFLGFDVLIDENLRPTLLEVNTNPSLGNDCQVDEVVKRPMLHELLSLLGLPDGRSSPTPGSYDHYHNHNGKSSGDQQEEDEDCCLENEEPFTYRSCASSQIRHGEYLAVGGERKGAKKSVLRGQNGVARMAKKWEQCETTKMNKKTMKRSLSAHPMVASSRRRAFKSQQSMDTTLGQKGGQQQSARTKNEEIRVLGDWVRIFPFDSQTKQHKNQMSVHDVRLVIARMHNYLKIASRIAEKRNKDDNFLDTMAKQYGHLSIEPWHPPLLTYTPSH